MEPHDTHCEPTQAMKIADRLRATPGEWVPMPELAAISGAYAVHSRVAELRAKGLMIGVKVEGSRPRHSFYRLETRVPGSA